MAEDPLADLFELVEKAAELARAALQVEIEGVARAREQRVAGATVRQVVDGLLARGLPEARREAQRAFGEYQRSLRVVRASYVRVLVDECGLTLTAVSELLGLSRQVVSRLYRPDPGGQRPEMGPKVP